MNFYSSVLLCIIASFSSILLAEEPQTKAQQCEQYGAYQDADGNWQTCEYEEESTPDVN